MDYLRAPIVSYREATVSDCVAVARTHVESWRQSFVGIVPQTFLDKMSIENRSKAFEKRFSDDSYKMFVAEVPERGVIGFVDFGEPRESIDTYEAELFAVYILPEFHRKGIGGRLFNLCIGNLVRNPVRDIAASRCLEPFQRFSTRSSFMGRSRKTVETVSFDFELALFTQSLKPRCE